MDEKSKKIMKIIMRALAACAGVFTLIGAIGFLVQADSIVFTSAIGPSISGFCVFHDFMRFGSFAVFTVSVFAVLFEYFSKSNTFKSAIAAASMSVFGFAACFISSITGFVSTTFSGKSDADDTIRAGIIISAIFAMVSAVFSIVSLVILLVKLNGGAAKTRYYTQQAYPAQPVLQQYQQPVFTPQSAPQQNFPQQAYPQQSFPQQNNPQQPFQQAPAQQQTYANPAGFPQGYQQQNPQNPFNQNNINPQ